MRDILDPLKPATQPEADHPFAHAPQVPRHPPRRRIKAVVRIRLHRVQVDIIPQRQDRRERVRELDDGGGADNRHKAEVIGDGAGDDEGDGPPNRHDHHPQRLAAFGGQRRRLQQIHQHVVVEDLDADVAVEAGGDEARDGGERVAHRLEAVLRQADVRRVEGVLALPVVLVAAVDQVDGVDEELRAPHRLDEVVRPPHLRHELDEELRAAVGEDALQQAVDRADQAAGVGEAVVVDDRGVVACGVGGDGGDVCGAAGGAERRDGVVGGRVRHDAHGDEDDEQVEEDGGVGEPAVVPQRAHLADEEADGHEDDAADDVAQAELAELGDALAEEDDDLAEDEQQQEGLEDVDDLAGDLAVGAER